MSSRERTGDGPRIGLQTGDHQRQRERQEEDRAEGQQAHERRGQREVAARGLDHLRQKRRARRAAEQEQSDGVSAIERDDDGEQPRKGGRDHEIQNQREQDEPHVAQRRDDRGQRERQAHREHAAHEKCEE